MEKREGYQQGDLLFLAAAAVPAGARRVEPGARGYVLAEGEHTGHAHTIEATPEVELYEVDGVLWLKVDAKASVTHQEHAEQQVEPGIYEVRRVVEVDPFSGEAASVAD